MRTETVLQGLGAKELAGGAAEEFDGVYAGDLLSRAMSHIAEGNLWITIMSNINVVAVASLLLRAEDHVPSVDNQKLPVGREGRQIPGREQREVEVREKGLVLRPKTPVLLRRLRKRSLELPHAHEARGLYHVLRRHASTPEA